MDKASIQTHLESCRERVVSQDTINASYSNKAMGITTLSLTLFGVGLSGFSGSTLEIVLVIISGVCVLVVSLYGVHPEFRDTQVGVSVCHWKLILIVRKNFVQLAPFPFIHGHFTSNFRRSPPSRACKLDIL